MDVPINKYNIDLSRTGGCCGNIDLSRTGGFVVMSTPVYVHDYLSTTNKEDTFLQDF